MPRCRLTFTCGLAMALWGYSYTAQAFKEPGHRAIEKAAYLELLGSAKGKAVLEKLISRGVLRAPQRPYPEPSGMNPDFARHTVHGLVLDTHLPDHLLDRQFDKDLQCFHFNARGSHVTKIAGRVYGVPRGLVEHAYVECLGIADALLRSVIFDPRKSGDDSVGIYALMHMIEDSYSDSHVARAVERDYRIIYLKPWTLRTWWSYLLFNPDSKNGAVHEHFSHSHHGVLESRDLGYLVGQWDSESCLDSKRKCTARQQRAYRARVEKCLDASAGLFGRRPKPANLEGNVIVPPECLSDRALEAKRAIVALLELVAKHIDHVDPPRDPVHWNAGVREVKTPEDGTFAEDWLLYRKHYLLHVRAELTEQMAVSEACPNGDCPDLRGNLVYPAEHLAPRVFRTAGVGLSTELTAGTPLWLGFEAFVAAEAGAHSKINPLTDFMGYAIQLRLPLEDELGERPIGLGLDFGPTLPVPVSELASSDPTAVALYLGLRGRVAYTAQSVFEEETRHVLSVGLGGVSVDLVVANRIWFGLDFPRFMWNYDFWTGQGATNLTWNFNGGIAVDAF